VGRKNTISGGILDFAANNENNIGSGSACNTSVAARGGIKFNTLSNALRNRIVETSDKIALMNGATFSNLDFSSSVAGINLPNAFLGNYAINGTKAEYSGTITPGSNGYKLGAIGSSGNLGIIGTNKITGANSLTVGQTEASGVRVTLSCANDFTGETVINTGARLALGNNLSLQNSPLNVGSTGGNIGFNEGTAATTITGNTVVTSPTFGGLIGSRNLSSVFTNANSNNENNIDANLVTGFTLNVGTGNTFTYSGAIGGFGTGTTNINGGGTGGNSTLTKTGNGRQILSDTSTYTGITQVDGGTLIVNGVLDTQTNGVLVNSPGTLGGSGIINRPVAVNGTISPGNSPGTLTTGSESWNAGGSYLWELNIVDPTSVLQTLYKGLTVGHDWLNIVGTLDVNSTLANLFSIDIKGLDGSNASGAVTNWDNSKNYAWVIATASDGLVETFDPSLFFVDDTAFVNNNALGGGSFAIVQGGGISGTTGKDIVLTFTATAAPVPELGTLCSWSVICLCVGIAVLRRRRLQTA